jgi:hypothetical protein
MYPNISEATSWEGVLVILWHLLCTLLHHCEGVCYDTSHKGWSTLDALGVRPLLFLLIARLNQPSCSVDQFTVLISMDAATIKYTVP